MPSFRVDDMTCGHCASTIARAARGLDGGARVQVDLPGHLVHIDSTDADPAALAGAITEAGYTPVPVAPPAATAASAPTGGGCACGRSSGS